jgi:ABC-type multidrug transport system fused ATPase/permease subunit
MHRLRKTYYFRSLALLDRKDRGKVVLVTLIQIGLSFLDLLGVATIGALGALTVSGVQSRGPGERVSQVLEWLGMQDATFQNQIATLGIIAAGLLVLRTLLSVLFTRRTLFYLSRRSAIISSRLVGKVLSQPLLALREKSSQETIFALTRGVELITVGVISTSITLVADISLLLVLSVGLFIVDPLLAFITMVMFGSLGYLVFRLMRNKAKDLGVRMSEYGYTSNKKILEVIQTYREAIIHNRRPHYIEAIASLRHKLSNATAEITFMPMISKYVFESAIVIGALALSAVQFSKEDAPRAVATLAIFLAAASRIAPAVLRLQQGALGIKSSIGGASETFLLIDSLNNSKYKEENFEIDLRPRSEFNPKVELQSISFDYGKSEWGLKGIDLILEPGQSLAVTGPSGAGKTTLIDILLGIISPSSGTSLISGVPSKNAIGHWPGAISYVPQDIFIVEGTIKENVGLGFAKDAISDVDVWEALERSHLAEFVRSMPEGINYSVGEFGSKLSGGQRQRLGIARALYTKPRLLVLDEATSALDNETESYISESLQELKGEVTVIMIAHRLSSVKSCDLVAYIENGRLIAIGGFDEVRSLVPNFDKQARLLEL